MIVLVTTCGIRKAHYLGRLLRQIDAGGWKGRRFIVSDGPPTIISGGWQVTATTKREGQKKAYWRALAVGLEESRKSSDDRILILEDDVELCTNALRYMERARLPVMLDFVTWFDGHVIPAGAAQGIYPVNAQYFFCLQGVTWKAATAEALLTSSIAANWGELHSGDILVAKILRGRRYGVHVPNLVQHLGSESICNPGQKLTGVRTSNNYPGAAFDASTLGTRDPGRRIVLSR